MYYLHVSDPTQGYFLKIPDGVPMDATVLTSSRQMVGSAIECAER